MTVRSWIRWMLTKPQQVETLLLGELEFVLVDIDLSGTNVGKDFVTGLAALPMSDGRFKLGDLRYCRFPCGQGNVQEVGAEYRAILDLLTERTVVTINPRFVSYMLEQAASRSRLPVPSGNWLDLSAAAGVVANESIAATSLLRWQEKMKVCGRHEHDAVYDVFAMAQLLQSVLAYAEERGIETMTDLLRNQNAENWLRPYS